MPEVPAAPTLSDIAYFSRLGIKYGALALVVLIVGRVMLNFSVNLYRTLNPPKPPPPTLGFGTLPEIAFGEDLAKPATYQLQTVGGTLPNLGDQIRVYFMPVEKPSLLAAERAQRQAASLGFVFRYEQVSSSVFRWTRTTPIPATLELNIVTNALKMRADWSANPAILTQKNLPSGQGTINEARALLRSASLLPADMATGEARIANLKSSGNTFAPAVSISEAEFVQVDLYRAQIGGKYPILGPDANKGNARVIFSGSREQGERIIQVDHSYYPIEYERFETYPLITTTEAWNRLQSGQGHVAAALPENVRDVVVRNVSLAYFESAEPQNYLQPVYVFTGDLGFVGYVPAASSVPVKK